jgi:hypothetical protein
MTGGGDFTVIAAFKGAAVPALSPRGKFYLSVQWTPGVCFVTRPKRVAPGLLNNFDIFTGCARRVRCFGAQRESRRHPHSGVSSTAQIVLTTPLALNVFHGWLRYMAISQSVISKAERCSEAVRLKCSTRQKIAFDLL